MLPTSSNTKFLSVVLVACIVKIFLTEHNIFTFKISNFIIKVLENYHKINKSVAVNIGILTEVVYCTVGSSAHLRVSILWLAV